MPQLLPRVLPGDLQHTLNGFTNMLSLASSECALNMDDRCIMSASDAPHVYFIEQYSLGAHSLGMLVHRSSMPQEDGMHVRFCIM